MADEAAWRRPIENGERIRASLNGQEWAITWHEPHDAPEGKRHGSAGLCVTGDGGIVLVSAEGKHWDWPAGRAEGLETWEETVRREVREEACAAVMSVRLLGFSRGRCERGGEEGLVLVRAIWRAEVIVEPWLPRFEMRYRQVVRVEDMWSALTVERGYLPTYRRAAREAGVL